MTNNKQIDNLTKQSKLDRIYEILGKSFLWKDFHFNAYKVNGKRYVRLTLWGIAIGMIDVLKEPIPFDLAEKWSDYAQFIENQSIDCIDLVYSLLPTI